MHQRSLAALAIGVVGLLAVAPALAADDRPEPSPAQVDDSTTSSSTDDGTPPSGDDDSTSSSSSTSSTSPDDSDDSSSSSTTATTGPGSGDQPPADDGEEPPTDDGESAAPGCSDARDEVAAPEEGSSEVFGSGEAGSVEVARTSPTGLEVVEATADDGWVGKVATPAGERVKVKFTDEADPAHVIRFAAALNSDGTQLRLKVSECTG
ncbi:MAG: hypothetical protein ACRDY7_00145 [Acidimicrobiia bacterium]